METVEIVASYEDRQSAERAVDLLTREHFAPHTLSVRAHRHAMPIRFRTRSVLGAVIGTVVGTVVVLTVMIVLPSSAYTTSPDLAPYQMIVMALGGMGLGSLLGILSGTNFWRERPETPEGQRLDKDDPVEVRVTVPPERRDEARGLLAQAGPARLRV